MKFTIDLEKYDSYNDLYNNGAKDFLEDIKKSMAKIMLDDIFMSYVDNYEDALLSVVENLKQDITNNLKSSINEKNIIEEVTSDLSQKLSDKICRMKMCTDIVKELTSTTESAATKELRKVIKEEIKKVIRV